MCQYIVLSRYAWYSIIEPMKYTNVLDFHAMQGNMKGAADSTDDICVSFYKDKNTNLATDGRILVYRCNRTPENIDL